MRDILLARAEAALRARVFPGCAIGVVRRGEEPEIVTVGAHSYDANARAVSASTLYDMASVTKSIPTASLALVLSTDGRIDLGERVREHLPELVGDFDATIRDLLLYRVAGTRLSDLKHLAAEEMLSTLLERGFEGPPGERNYTNMPALLLGLVLERVMNTTLDILARRYFFDPLRMHDTVFYAGAYLAHAAPTELEEWRGLVQGVTHDESAFTLARAGRATGHAGLFSTLGDMLAFLRALLDERDARVRGIVRGAQEGLGWQVAQPYFMGSHASATTFGKTGFTGTSVVVDEARGVAFAILSNRTYPKRPPDAIAENCAINVFRSDIADIVLSEVH